jgi:hypothetical protein
MKAARWPQCRSRRGRDGLAQFVVQPGEGIGRAVVGAQAEHEAPRMLDDASSAVDELLHHRLDAPYLGGVALQCLRAQQPALADQAQVHRHRGELAHEAVGVELARGQPGEIQIGLELGVELLVRAVVGIQLGTSVIPSD